MDGSTRRVTIWRIASILIVVFAVAGTAASLWQGISESDRDQRVAAREIETVGTEVRVTGFGDPFGFTVEVLGNPGTEVTVNEVGVAAEVATPDGGHILALTRPSGALLGLHRVAPSGSDATAAAPITISPQTTAATLVALAPGVLNTRGATTDRRVAEVTGTVEFGTLVAEIARNSDLAVQNARLDAALANVLSRIPGTPQPDETQCDAADAIAAGVCLSFGLDATVVPSNAQNRWAVAFEADTTEACALIPPASPDPVADLAESCGRIIDIAAPGPIREGIGPMAEDQQVVASFLTSLTEFALPFAELTLGADSSDSDPTLSATLQRVPTTASRLFGGIADAQPDARPAAAALSSRDSDDVQRSAALLTLSRLALTNAELPSMLLDQPDFAPSSASVALLNLYERAAQNRTGGIGPPRWNETGWSRVDMAALVPGETP